MTKARVSLAALAAALAVSGCGSARPASPSKALSPATVRQLDPAAYHYARAQHARVEPDAATGTFAVASADARRASRLVVAVHGHGGNAFTQFRLWAPYARRHHLGVVSVEWETRWGADAQFLAAPDAYGLIVRSLGATRAAGRVLLHGFSMGSHLAFELTSLDRRGRRLFALTVAESGGTRSAPGGDPALAGSTWLLYCAGRDEWPQISGCPAMRRARAFLLSSRARVVRFLVDPPAHHGGLLLNRRLVERVLSDYERRVPAR